MSMRIDKTSPACYNTPTSLKKRMSNWLNAEKEKRPRCLPPSGYSNINGDATAFET